MSPIHRLVAIGLCGLLLTSSQPASAALLAWYDFEAGGNGDFNNAAFDSVDADPWSSASRLFQGGGLTGGGAGNFITNSVNAGGGLSGHPNLNLGAVNTASFAAATTANDFFSFTVTPVANPLLQHVVYQTLTFYSNTVDTTNPRIAVSLNGTLLDTKTPPLGNNLAQLFSVDLGDYVSDDPVTFRFTLYGTSAVNNAIRFDDIQLFGEQVFVPEPSSAVLLLLGAAIFGAGRRMTQRKRKLQNR